MKNKKIIENKDNNRLNREINLRCIPIEIAGKTISRRTSTKTLFAFLELILFLLPL